MRVLWILVSSVAGLAAAGLVPAGQTGLLAAAISIVGAAIAALIGFVLYEAWQAYRRHVRRRDDGVAMRH
jgi:hypothetical protein